jgi:hypothetical protein
MCVKTHPLSGTLVDVVGLVVNIALEARKRLTVYKTRPATQRRL